MRRRRRARRGHPATGFAPDHKMSKLSDRAAEQVNMTPPMPCPGSEDGEPAGQENGTRFIQPGAS